jgi:glycosyltransferase involved in cell wall biosynthesis
VTPSAGPTPEVHSRQGLKSLAVFHLGGAGGPQRSLRGVMTWLGDRGTVEFIVPELGAAASQYRELGAVTVGPYTALTNPLARMDSARRLRDDVRFFRGELQRRRPDVVVVVTMVLPALLIAARREGVPSVVYAAELYRQRSPLRRLWGAVLAGVTAALSDGVVSCSSVVARQFPRWGGKPRAIAYPPIDLQYAQGDRARGRARYGLAQDDFCIVVIGNVSRGRGQDVAIRALELVRRRMPSARLLCIGASHQRAVDLEFADELPQLAAALGLGAAVTFAEETDEVADVYAAADLVLNPARFESFGRVAAEALVAGRPVVSSSVGGIPEVIRDGVDGLLVPPDDPVAMADAVCRIALEPALGERLVTAGRNAVLERFGPQQDLDAWRSVLEAALLRRGVTGYCRP